MPYNLYNLCKVIQVQSDSCPLFIQQIFRTKKQAVCHPFQGFKKYYLVLLYIISPKEQRLGFYMWQCFCQGAGLGFWHQKKTGRICTKEKKQDKDLYAKTKHIVSHNNVN